MGGFSITPADGPDSRTGKTDKSAHRVAGQQDQWVSWAGRDPSKHTGAPWARGLARQAGPAWPGPQKGAEAASPGGSVNCKTTARSETGSMRLSRSRPFTDPRRPVPLAPRGDLEIFLALLSILRLTARDASLEPQAETTATMSRDSHPQACHCLPCPRPIPPALTPAQPPGLPGSRPPGFPGLPPPPIGRHVPLRLPPLHPTGSTSTAQEIARPVPARRRPVPRGRMNRPSTRQRPLPACEGRQYGRRRIFRGRMRGPRATRPRRGPSIAVCCPRDQPVWVAGGAEAIPAVRTDRAVSFARRHPPAARGTALSNHRARVAGADRSATARLEWPGGERADSARQSVPSDRRGWRLAGGTRMPSFIHFANVAAIAPARPVLQCIRAGCRVAAPGSRATESVQDRAARR